MRTKGRTHLTAIAAALALPAPAGAAPAQAKTFKLSIGARHPVSSV